MRKPKSIVHLYGRIESSHSMYRLGVAGRLRAILQDTPGLLIPTQFSPHEPKYLRFSVDDDESYSRAVRSGGNGGVSFTLYYRGELHGSLSVRASKPKQLKLTKWSNPVQNYIELNLEYRGVDKNNLLCSCSELFDRLVEISSPYYALFSLTTNFKNGDTYMDYRPEPVEYNGVCVHCGGSVNPELPCLPIWFFWRTYVGPEYVRPIGQEKFLALDLHRSWPSPTGGVWLQLTERPEEMHIPEVQERVVSKIRALEKAGIPNSAPEIDFSELLADPNN